MLLASYGMFLSIYHIVDNAIKICLRKHFISQFVAKVAPFQKNPKKTKQMGMCHVSPVTCHLSPVTFHLGADSVETIQFKKTKYRQRMLATKSKFQQKIPHTGDTNSLNRCG